MTFVLNFSVYFDLLALAMLPLQCTGLACALGWCVQQIYLQMAETLYTGLACPAKLLDYF